MTIWNPKKAKQLIAQRGRTRVWLADQCGIGRGSLNNILRGSANPGLAVLKLMAQALETTEEELLGETRRPRATSG